VDFQTLYNMTASVARNAERMCSQEGGSENGLPFQNYAGYPFYIDKYNQFVFLATQLDPDVSIFFQEIDLGDKRNPGSIPGFMWKSYAELAAMQLNSLASYLQSKLGTKQQEHEQIIDLIKANLRPAIYDDPKHEREVQNALETIFRARALDFRREQQTVPYSTKRYIPDFTFDRIGLAVEAKLCKDKDREREMIDEINADIVGYGGRYDRCLFVIYDLGFIRDVAKFSADIEANPNVHVLIIKK
jgi:REase_DpnII-MboI